MKRFWWDEEREQILWDRGQSDCVLRSDESGMFDTDYRGSEPREIQSAEYDPVSGRIKLVPKEPAKPRKVMVEIELPEESLGRVHVYGFYGDGSYKAVRLENDDRLSREFRCSYGEYGGVCRDSVVEKQQPSNPYTKAAVDELLCSLNSYMGPFFSEPARWTAAARRVAAAAKALLRQCDSGKAGA